MRPAVAIALSLGISAVVACSASDFGMEPSGSTGFGATTNTATGAGASGATTTGAGGEGLTAFDYSEYCGDGCVPEETKPAELDPCEAAGGAGGAGGGTGGAGDVDCKLGFDDMLQATAGMCMAPGNQPDGAACVTSADCAPDHGCVNEDGNGVCHQYCCGALEDCPDQVTFCDLRPLFDAQPSIPVCAPVEDCTLLADTCLNGKTCTIVRQDGTTSCVMPGPGEHGDPCPCAADHVCATGLNQCLRLCHTDGSDPPCPDVAPKCQGGATIYPPGFGVCVEN